MSGPKPIQSNKSAPHDLSPISYAINHSIRSVISGGLSGDIEEETTTGAILGGASSIINHLRDKALDETDISSLCNWVQYKKSGGSLASEAYTGADFALIIKVSEQIYRAAVFQAKRAKNLDDGFLAIQISPPRFSYIAEPQIIRLLRYSCRPGQMSLDASIKNATWAHFIIYSQTAIRHTPLSSMRTYLQDAVIFNNAINKDVYKNIPKNIDSKSLFKYISARWKKFPGHTYTPDSQDVSELTELIELATNKPADEEIPGWLKITGTSTAEAFIEATIPYFNTFEIALANNYEPLLKNSSSVQVATATGSGLAIKPDSNIHPTNHLSKPQTVSRKVKK